LHHIPSGTLGKIGFALPESFACPINHKSLPVKDLPFASLRCKLGLFVQHAAALVPQAPPHAASPPIGFFCTNAKEACSGASQRDEWRWGPRPAALGWSRGSPPGAGVLHVFSSLSLSSKS
jgi:hypothetical protein